MNDNQEEKKTRKNTKEGTPPGTDAKKWLRKKKEKE